MTAPRMGVMPVMPTPPSPSPAPGPCLSPTPPPLPWSPMPPPLPEPVRRHPDEAIGQADHRGRGHVDVGRSDDRRFHHEAWIVIEDVGGRRDELPQRALGQVALAGGRRFAAASAASPGVAEDWNVGRDVAVGDGDHVEPRSDLRRDLGDGEDQHDGGGVQDSREESGAFRRCVHVRLTCRAGRCNWRTIAERAVFSARARRGPVERSATLCGEGNS